MNSGCLRRRLIALSNRSFAPKSPPTVPLGSSVSLTVSNSFVPSLNSRDLFVCFRYQSTIGNRNFGSQRRSVMSEKAGKSGDGVRRGDKSPVKKGGSPSTLNELSGKDRASETIKSVSSDADSPRPLAPDAIKTEVSDIKPESKEVAPSISSEGTDGEDDSAEDSRKKDSNLKVEPDKESSPVTSTLDVKMKEPKSVGSKEQDGNKTGQTKQISPDVGTKSNLLSDNGSGSSKKKVSPESNKQRPYYGTRHSTAMQERERFLAMTLEEKRKFYASKDYITLDDIETWKQFYSQNRKPLARIYPNAKLVERMLRDFPEIEVDEKLNSKVSLFEGDITTLEIDAIVNAANRSLLGGGGVDGAIHRAAGSALVEECRSLSGCETGEAKTTCGYKLPAKYVIHTVGPQTTSRSDLRSCYVNCFREMAKHNMQSIAFCCISTGIYGFPNDLAVHEALGSARKYLMQLKHDGKIDMIDRIIFCLFLPIDIKLYQTWMQVYFPVEPKENINSNDNSTCKSTAEISSDSDSPSSAKDGKVSSSASESHDSSSMDVGEENLSGENLDEDARNSLPSNQPKESADSPGDSLPDKKSKMDPDVKLSAKFDVDQAVL